MPMRFDTGQNLKVSGGSFNDVGQNQNIYNMQTALFIGGSISSRLQQAESHGSREQLQALSASINTLLSTLDTEYRAERLLESNTSDALKNLNSLLHNIYAFIQKETSTEFMKSVSLGEDRIAEITSYYHQLDASIASFQISSLLNVRDWQKRNDDARLKDQTALHNRLNELESNHSQLRELLSTQHHSLETMMVSLTKIIEERSGGDRELKFFSCCVGYLSAMSRRPIRRESWMITSFDIEFGSEIGSGGFARIFEGTWNKMRVAVKVLKSDEGITPNPDVIIHEISTWSSLSHPHILQFLGANVLDSKPFIVTPIMDNGNAMTYIRKHPSCDRLTIIQHVSFGIMYLHSINIVHSDLKAQNVLIDDSGRALLCDFGLARVKADIMSRSMITDVKTTAGSRYWMAPERLVGKSPKKSSDVYAFGCTAYEIYTNEIPLGHVTPAELRELVVHQHLRPERPDRDEAPQLTDEIWKLMEDCWVDKPPGRPTADAICDRINSILDNHKISRSATPKPKPTANFEPLTSTSKSPTQTGQLDIISSSLKGEAQNQEYVTVLNPPASVSVQADHVAPDDDLNHARMDSLPPPTASSTFKLAANFEPLTSISKPSTQTSEQVDNIPSDSKRLENQECAAVLNSLTNDPTQADSIAPGDNGHRTKMDNSPPSTSFASDKKKTLGIRQFPNQQHKSSNETPLPKQIFTKPSQLSITDLNVSREVARIVNRTGPGESLPMGTTTQSDADVVFKPMAFLKDLLMKHTGTLVKVEGQDIIILVVGPAGAGKSSFIEMATGKPPGHGLGLSTREVQFVSCLYPKGGKQVFFVDTPGLHEEGNIWADAGKEIQKWMKTRVPAEQNFTGVLYLHNIMGKRMTEEPFTSARMFELYCGYNLGRKICVTTTHWSRVPETVGVIREQEIEDKCCATGTTVARFLRTRESAWEVVETLLQASLKESLIEYAE